METSVKDAAQRGPVDGVVPKAGMTTSVRGIRRTVFGTTVGRPGPAAAGSLPLPEDEGLWTGHLGDRCAAGRPGGASLPAVILGLWTLAMMSVCARIPEPDAIVHGRIVIDGQVIGAARTDVVVEARRLADGVILAGYRMGSDPGVGDRYVLRIPLESGTPSVPPMAAAVGETVQLEFRSAVQVLDQRTQALVARGQFQRLDLTLGGGGDTNGMPDDWEILHFGSAGQDPDDDADGDGRTNREEYQAGTNPREAEDVLAVVAEAQSANVRLSFLARQATGPGYPSGTRIVFGLEGADAPTGPWLPVPGLAEVTGNNQVVVFDTAREGTAGFYRVRARLEVNGTQP